MLSTRLPAPLTRLARPLRAPAVVAAAMLALTIAPAPAAAWSPSMQEAVALEAARFAPAELRAELRRHARSLAAGAREPIAERDGNRHVKNDDGSGRLDRVLAEEVAAAIDAVRAGRSWTEIARRLGRVSHFAADLNQPLNTSARDREEGRFFRDFALYADSARPRFALVTYAVERPLGGSTGLRQLTEEALVRGRRLYPAVGREYRRVGYAAGAGAFDDRSTAFAVAALSYSHAVSDAARLFRHIWAAAATGAPDRIAAVRAPAAGGAD